MEHAVHHAWMLAPTELCFRLSERVHLSSLGALLRDPSQSNYSKCGVCVHRARPQPTLGSLLTSSALQLFPSHLGPSSLSSHFDDVSKLCIKLIWVSNASRLPCQT